MSHATTPVGLEILRNHPSLRNAHNTPAVMIMDGGRIAGPQIKLPIENRPAGSS